MFDFLAERRARQARDLQDARNLIAAHGEAAGALARERADDATRSERYRQHWRRVARVIAKELKAKPR